MAQQIYQFQPNKQKGISLSFVSLLLLGTLPIISNSRPQELDAFNFSLYLSIWQLICALPLLFVEKNQGIMNKDLSKASRNKTIFSGVSCLRIEIRCLSCSPSIPLQ